MRVHTRTDMWYYEPCNIVQFMDSFLYVRPLWHSVWNKSEYHCHYLGLCETSYKDNWDADKHAMRASPFRSALAMSQCHSHHVCVLQTLHVRKLRIKTVVHCMFLLKQTFWCHCYLSCLLLCIDSVWHLISLSTIQRSIFLWSDMDILDVCNGAL